MSHKSVQPHPTFEKLEMKQNALAHHFDMRFFTFKILKSKKLEPFNVPYAFGHLTKKGVQW